MTNACSVLLTIRFGGFMVHKVKSSHDLSGVFAYLCNTHLYLEHTIRFVKLHVSVSSVFAVVLMLTASQS